MEPYETMIHELGQLLETELHPDENNTCLVEIDGKLEVYLEIDTDTDQLMIGSPLGKPNPGKERELFCQRALQWNGLQHNVSSFGYSQQTTDLVLFRRFPFRRSSADLLEALLDHRDQAFLWQEAIQRGLPPDLPPEPPLP